MKAERRMRIPRGSGVFSVTALAALVIGAGGLTLALAGPPGLPAHFTGVLNDYTPLTDSAGVAISGSPYEMHGKWSLDLNPGRGTATFSAEMTMETADFANTDPMHNPTKLAPHTHHITVTDGVIHDGPTDWMELCNPMFKPPVAGGFAVTGTANVTGNGGNPPFGNPSAVTICILGGVKTVLATPYASVEYSNFTLTFTAGSPASTHFGSQAINGAVVRCYGPTWQASQECAVAVQNEEN